MAEVIVFAEQFMIDHFSGKVVVDALTRGYVLPTVSVPIHITLQAFKHLAPDQHAAGTYVPYLERHVHADHFMSIQFIDIEVSGKFAEILGTTQGTLPDGLPVDAFHGHYATNDVPASTYQPGYVFGAELLICVHEQEMAGIGLHEVVRDGIAATLYQAFVAQEYAGHAMSGRFHA
jgi:hypothetical protein